MATKHRSSGSRGRPDATGRSSGKRTGREAKAHKIDGPFVAHRRELIESDAWRAQGINCRRCIEFLEIEHMCHAGWENGKLMAPYEQLAAFGLSPRLIKSAIDEAEFLGLVVITDHEYKKATRYRLTYLAVRDEPPTDDWKKVTKEAIKQWTTEQTKKRKARESWRVNKKAAYRNDSNLPSHVVVDAGNTGGRR